MGLLSFFMVLGFSSLTIHRYRIGSIAIIITVALLVTLDEIIQLAIPTRTFSLEDLAWSLVGVATFGLAAAFIEWFWCKRTQG
jgi:VanZ family protein